MKRRRPPLISRDDIFRMERLIRDQGYNARVLTQEALAREADIVDSTGKTPHQHTIQRAIGTLDYYRCPQCKTGWVHPRIAEKRVEFSKIMLERYPNKEDWRHIRFCNEMHIGYSAEYSPFVTRKPGERFCSNYMSEYKQKVPSDRELKRLHFVAAVGYDFKSELHEYFTPKNENGKLNIQQYVDQWYKPVVARQIARKDVFVLEEDGDSSHGKGVNNLARKWREKHGVNQYFNCVHSPDLAPIENGWSAPKEKNRIVAHWDDDTTRQLAHEGWNELTQKTINSWCDSMPDRLRAVIQREGQMTGYYIDYIN